MDYKIFWTEEAIRNLEEIVNYLLSSWTQKENFRSMNLTFHNLHLKISTVPHNQLIPLCFLISLYAALSC